MSESLKKIPNSVGVLVLGIVSIPTCFCYGIVGLICGIIALYLHSQGMKSYHSEPESYETSNLGMMKAGRICGIIGLSLSAIYLIIIIAVLVMSGTEGFQELMDQRNF